MLVDAAIDFEPDACKKLNNENSMILEIIAMTELRTHNESSIAHISLNEFEVQLTLVHDEFKINIFEKNNKSELAVISISLKLYFSKAQKQSMSTIQFCEEYIKSLIRRFNHILFKKP